MRLLRVRDRWHLPIYKTTAAVVFVIGNTVDSSTLAHFFYETGSLQVKITFEFKGTGILSRKIVTVHAVT
jgi:hypothetical protein